MESYSHGVDNLIDCADANGVFGLNGEGVM